MNFKIQGEFARFLVAGFSAVGVDLLSYYAFLLFFGHNLSKCISFILGSAVAFTINKYWTFKKYDRSYAEIVKFSMLYLATLGLNVIANKFVLDLTDIVFFGFLAATAISTILNFIGQKWWVFKI